MDPLTKADLKELMKELWDDIKESVAEEFSSWKPYIKMKITDLEVAVGLL